jgi:hypothetical protein
LPGTVALLHFISFSIIFLKAKMRHLKETECRRAFTCSVPAFHRTIWLLLPGRRTVVGRI